MQQAPFCLVLIALGVGATVARAEDRWQRPVESPVPATIREQFQLSDFYQKCVSADGLPIVSSAKVSDYALLEAAWLIDQMLVGREDIRKALVKSKTRFTVMAPDEFTTQVPEHSDLRPARFWDRRARGLGATPQRPSVSCGEENLLQLRGDPYRTENILIHEFAHAMHQMGLNNLDPNFQARLEATYQRAMDAGLWKDKYAANNPAEYWAEGVQSWFDTNREHDHDHNHVNTRAELKEYDPGLAKLIEEVYGDRPWRYVPPNQRPEPGHLAGFDRTKGGSFAWPPELEEWYRNYQAEQRQKKSQ